MEASSQLAFQVTQERLVEPRAASGTVALGDAEQQRQLRAIEIGLAAQGLVDGSRSHLQQLGAAAPGLLQRHAGGKQPFAALVDETGFLEVVQGAADRRAAGRRAEADRADHAGGDDAQGLAHASSSSAWRLRANAASEG